MRVISLFRWEWVEIELSFFILTNESYLSFQMGVGGDNRAPHQGAHVCQPDHRRMCMGPTSRCQNVSNQLLSWWLEWKISIFVKLPLWIYSSLIVSFFRYNPNYRRNDWQGIDFRVSVILRIHIKTKFLQIKSVLHQINASVIAFIQCNSETIHNS